MCGVGGLTLSCLGQLQRYVALGSTNLWVAIFWVSTTGWVQGPKRPWLLCFCDGFRVWESGGKCGILGFDLMRRPYILARFLIKETRFVWRLNALSLGVEVDSSSLLEFFLISISCRLVEAVLYCFSMSLFWITVL